MITITYVMITITYLQSGRQRGIYWGPAGCIPSLHLPTGDDVALPAATCTQDLVATRQRYCCTASEFGA